MPLSQNELVWLYLAAALEDAGMEEILGDENVYGVDGFILTVGSNFIIRKEFSRRLGHAQDTDYVLIRDPLGDQGGFDEELGCFRTPREIAEGVVLLFTSYWLQVAFEELEDTILRCCGVNTKKWERARLGPKGEKDNE